MITSEIKVNGCLIGHLYIVNITDHDDPTITRTGQDTYRCSYHSIDSGKTEEFTLYHKRSDGAEMLMLLAFKEIYDASNG